MDGSGPYSYAVTGGKARNKPDQEGFLIVFLSRDGISEASDDRVFSAQSLPRCHSVQTVDIPWGLFV